MLAGAAIDCETVLMQLHQPQRGFISISGVMSLVILAALIFLALRLLPPYISNYQLQDAIQNIVLTATYAPMTEEDILRNVIVRARGYDIELRPKQVTVHKKNGTVIIVAVYTVPVNLLVRQLDLHFEPSASNQNITAQ